MDATAPTRPGSEASQTFPCPRCRLAHPWAESHAGKTARCGCGHVFKFPATLATAPSIGIAAPPSHPVSPPPLPAASGDDTASAVPAFLRMPAGMAHHDETLPSDVEAELAATGRYGEEDFTKPDPRRDVHVPLALVIVGFVLTAIDIGFAMNTHAGSAVAAGILVAGVKLVVGMLFMLGGALLAAKFAGINFGPLGTALLKLAGLCMAPSALGDLTTTLLGGDVAVAQIGWVVRVILYWALVSYLFRLDGGQTSIVVGTITVVKIVTTVVIGSLLFIAVAPLVPAGEGLSDDEGADPAITSLEDGEDVFAE